MSGIVAIKGEFEDKAFDDMIKKLKHRGPDGEIIFSNGNIKLGEVYFDLEDVNYNNYNYKLLLDGEPLLDNKVISKNELLNMYRSKGPEFLKEIEGKFAMIITNGNNIFAARDLFGIKPLYYSKDETSICFASEMKALIKDYDNVNVFPPGHYYTPEEGFKKFKDVPQIKSDNHLEIEDAAERLKDLLTEAVELSLKKENTGFFLSGGVDSSVIVAVAREVFDKKIISLVAGLKDSDDIHNSRKAAQYLGTEHSEYIYDSKEMFKVLPEVIYYLESFDVEMVNSSIANYFVSKLAQDKGLKVILSGEGADELFAGYHFLKDKKKEGELTNELAKLLKGLHNGGFQRVDRMAKACSLEVEMPFMYHKLVDFALKLPDDYKISEEEMGKWLLRKAFAGDIPDDIIWRRKAQFGIGTGNESIMEKLIEEKVSDEEFSRENKKEGITFKSKEEYYYYKIFKELFPSKAAEKTVNRWQV